jgi:hypothetical protein
MTDQVSDDSAQPEAKAETPPDRLSTEMRSPHFDADVLSRGIGIIFNGTEKHNVEEYCVSEGWIKVAMSKTRDRKGNPLTITLKGDVQPFFRDAAQK